MYCLGEFSSTIVSIYWTLLVPACYILAFFPSNITYSKDLFYFFVPFCFHASLVFCTHTHTHFLLTTRYLTVTEGKFHLIPFHIIRHLLGSHCHVMTISEGREWTFQLRFLFLMSHKYIHTLEITFLPLYWNNFCQPPGLIIWNIWKIPIQSDFFSLK